VLTSTAKFIFAGELEVSVRTASKYDDCRLLHVPHAKLVIKLGWKCNLGNADDHHGVSPCSPHRLPEYSSNVTHDSYRAFRSDNLDLNVSLDTKPLLGKKATGKSAPAAASVLFFASTCRWFENLKFILSGEFLSPKVFTFWCSNYAKFDMPRRRKVTSD
jgi:hypothetical protein